MNSTNSLVVPLCYCLQSKYLASLRSIPLPMLVFTQLFLLPHVSHLVWKANTPCGSDFAKSDSDLFSTFCSVSFSLTSLLWYVQEQHMVFYMWSHFLCAISIIFLLLPCWKYFIYVISHPTSILSVEGHVFYSLKVHSICVLLANFIPVLLVYQSLSVLLV